MTSPYINVDLYCGGNSVSPEPMAALVRANYVEPLRTERVLPLLAGTK